MNQEGVHEWNDDFGPVDQPAHFLHTIFIYRLQSFSTSIYASSWFLTLFTTTLSLPLACRIMDVFLSEGIEIVFKVALAMLTLGKSDLLSLDMESILKVTKKSYSSFQL